MDRLNEFYFDNVLTTSASQDNPTSRATQQIIIGPLLDAGGGAGGVVSASAVSAQPVTTTPTAGSGNGYNPSIDPPPAPSADSVASGVAGVIPSIKTTATGQTVTVTDADGNATTYVYKQGRLVRITDPLGHSTLYRYDAQGRIAAVTDADGGRRTFYYNAANQIVLEEWYGVKGHLVDTLRFSYNAAGVMTSASVGAETGT